MPEDMKKKMARLRAMRKPKKGGKKDPLEATLIQAGVPEDEANKLFKASSIDPSRVFSREDWDTMMPGINLINPVFADFLSKMLVLDDFQRGRISSKDLAKVAAREGFDTWVLPKIEAKFKDASKKYLARQKKRKAKKGKGMKGKGAIDNIRKFLDPFGVAEKVSKLKDPEVGKLVSIVKTLDPKVASVMALIQKGRQFLRNEDGEVELPGDLTMEDVEETIERSLEEYIDLFEDVGGFPDSLAEPNAARRGDRESKGKAGFGKKGRGQNGLAGNPSTNPKPYQYVIPVKQVNSSTSKGDPRGAMSGFKAIGRSPNASSFAQVSF